MLTKPIGDIVLTPATGRDGEHSLLCLIGVRPRAPHPSVHFHEGSKRHPSSPLVAVGKRMVLGEPHDEHGGLVHEVRIEVGVAEAGRRSVQRRVARSRFVTLMTVSRSSPVTSAAMTK